MMRSSCLVMLVGLCLVGVVDADPPEPQASYESAPRLAIPSDTGHYLGYYVGGGSGHPRKAEPRRADEGTWGWDYQGWLVRRRVILGWWHGGRYQGGTGAYKTDGSRLYQEK